MSTSAAQRLHEASANEGAGTVAFATRPAQRVKLSYERGYFGGVEETSYVADDRATRYLAMCHASYLSCGHGPGSFRCAGPLFMRICRTNSSPGIGRHPSVRRAFYAGESTERAGGSGSLPPSNFSLPSLSRVSGESARADLNRRHSGYEPRSSIQTEVRALNEGGRWRGRPHLFQGGPQARDGVRCYKSDRLSRRIQGLCRINFLARRKPGSADSAMKTIPAIQGFSSAHSPGDEHSARSHSVPPMNRTHTSPTARYVTKVVPKKISAASSHRIATNPKPPSPAFRQSLPRGELRNAKAAWWAGSGACWSGWSPTSGAVLPTVKAPGPAAALPQAFRLLVAVPPQGFPGGLPATSGATTRGGR
jgi:hypothetical protein